MTELSAAVTMANDVQVLVHGFNADGKLSPARPFLEWIGRDLFCDDKFASGGVELENSPAQNPKLLSQFFWNGNLSLFGNGRFHTARVRIPTSKSRFTLQPWMSRAECLHPKVSG